MEKQTDTLRDQKKREDDKQDGVVKDSFPASDPPANSGIVGPRLSTPTSDHRDPEARPKGTPTDDRHAVETAYHQESDDPPGR
ncbi:MAG: hypothetical protein WDN25_16410 [Acetobacteraceae bacterium]